MTWYNETYIIRVMALTMWSYGVTKDKQLCKFTTDFFLLGYVFLVSMTNITPLLLSVTHFASCWLRIMFLGHVIVKASEEKWQEMLKKALKRAWKCFDSLKLPHVIKPRFLTACRTEIWYGYSYSLLVCSSEMSS